jgi:hypothetical protein
LLSVRAFAGDYTPWPGREPAPIAGELTELAQQGERCCKRCTKGKPCGNSCIAQDNKCKQPPGCAHLLVIRFHPAESAIRFRGSVL